MLVCPFFLLPPLSLPPFFRVLSAVRGPSKNIPAVSAMQNAATAAFVASGFLALAFLGGVIKLALLERKEKQLTGAAS